MTESNGKGGSSVEASKVFLSWSGERSRALARAVKEWLPLVLHFVEPWMSEADIGAGERWSPAIGEQLEACQFGIICVTGENLAAPWLLFESGALAKSIKDSRVVPLLLGLDLKDLSGPLAQFQAKKAERSGLLEVAQSINQQRPLISEPNLSRLFDALWPDLQKRIEGIAKPASSPKAARSNAEVMEDLVAGVRALARQNEELLQRIGTPTVPVGFAPPPETRDASVSVGRPASASLVSVAAGIREFRIWATARVKEQAPGWNFSELHLEYDLVARLGDQPKPAIAIEFRGRAMRDPGWLDEVAKRVQQDASRGVIQGLLLVASGMSEAGATRALAHLKARNPDLPIAVWSDTGSQTESKLAMYGDSLFAD